MTTSLPEYLRTGRYREAVGRVLVRFPKYDDGGWGAALKDFSTIEADPRHKGILGIPDFPDLRTILIADDPGEVGAMCSIESRCLTCADPDEWTDHSQHGDPLPMTARLFAWNGEPVKWEAVLGDCYQRPWPDADHRLCNLTAVLLAGKYDELAHGYQTVAAREACASAGVQFVGPEGKLEL